MEFHLYHFGSEERIVKDRVCEIVTNKPHVLLSEEWFFRRFVQNPFGKAIIAYAVEGEYIAAVAILERVPLQFGGKYVIGGCIRGVYMQPDLDNPSLATQLVELLQAEAEKEEIDILYTFNGSLCRRLYGIAGWQRAQSSIRFRLKSIDTLNSIFKLIDMEQPLVPFDHSPLSGTVMHSDNSQLSLEQESDTMLTYLQWLSTSSVSERFIQVNTDKVYAMVVIGSRGKSVWEAHIVYMVHKHKGLSVTDCYQEVKELIGKIKGMDVISCLDSQSYVPKDGTLTTSQSFTVCYHAMINDIEKNHEDLVKELAGLRYV